MAFNHDASRNGSMAQLSPQGPQGGQMPMAGWKAMTATSASAAPVAPSTPSAPVAPAKPEKPARGRRGRLLAVISVVLLVVLIFAALRFSMMATATDDLLQVRIGDQQPATVDLRQSIPISPYFLGTNVFPLAGSSSIDAVSSGFMDFTPLMKSDLSAIHIGILRYPGGNWGEQHFLSNQQLDQFAAMLNATHSQGMIQTYIPTTPAVKTTAGDPVSLAQGWVYYMNNKNDPLRSANSPFHPVEFWTVGNEPDRLVDQNNKPYTAAEYAALFISYSIAMHKTDPNIKIYGPEISQFYGIGAGPFDSTGAPWMETFLKIVGDYQKTHAAQLASMNITHLLDGVSFHRYQFNNAQDIPGLLLSSPNEWNYTLPALRQEIVKDLGYAAPIAITEINTNPAQGQPTRGQAALWLANTLGTLMEQQVTDVGFFSTVDVENPYPLFEQQGNQESAMFRVMQLFSHLQKNLVPLAVQQTPIGVYATQDSSHQLVSLLFVNSSSQAQVAQIDPLDSVLGISAWQHLTVTLAADSIVEVTLHRNGSASDYATAYSYQVPTTNSPDVQPLLYTVCGQKQDALASNIPC